MRWLRAGVRPELSAGGGVARGAVVVTR